MAEGRRRLFGVLTVLVAVFGASTLAGSDDGGGAFISSSSPTVAQAAGAPAEPEVPTTVAAPPPAPATTTTTRAAVTRVLSASASAVTTTTAAAAPATTVTTAVTTSTTAFTPPPPPTTSTTVLACRNSTDPACGPFYFDPQPGPDTPMSVHVVLDPPAPVAGEEVVFSITLTDPDGVSVNGSTYNFGDSGIGESSVDPCTKYGPWEPPARDPAHATEVITLPHTYRQAGTYRATFIFTGFPFACEDSVTGRGDRPYASSASGTVTFDVR